MPTWRRKRDGRPYADIQIDGHRRRISLLQQSHIDAGTLAPDDSTCQALYDAFLRDVLPQIEVSVTAPVESRPTPYNPTLTSLVTHYLDTTMAARGAKPSSRARNRKILDAFLQFCHQRGVYHINHLSHAPATISAYTALLRDSYAPGTILLHLRTIQAMFNAAEAAGIDIPRFTWPRIRRPDPIYSEPLSPDTLQRFLSHLRTGRHTRSGAVHATNIITFLICVGCRPIDACELRWDSLHDLDTDRPLALFAQMKTGKRVAVALSRPALAVIRLERQRHESNPRLAACDHVFLNRHGRPYSATSLTSYIIRLARQAGCPGISAVRLRQTFTTTMYDLGADDALVRAATGHASQVIRIYRKLRRGAAHDATQQVADILIGDGAYPNALPKNT